MSVPPCDSAIPRLTDRPRPVPPLSRFVVKNGSKIRSNVPGSMPGTVVADHGDDVPAVAVHLHPHAAAVRHRLPGVCDQVEEDLLQLVRARLDGCFAVVIGVDELDGLVRVRPPDQVDVERMTSSSLTM